MWPAQGYRNRVWVGVTVIGDFSIELETSMCLNGSCYTPLAFCRPVCPPPVCISGLSLLYVQLNRRWRLQAEHFTSWFFSLYTFELREAIQSALVFFNINKMRSGLWLEFSGLHQFTKPLKTTNSSGLTTLAKIHHCCSSNLVWPRLSSSSSRHYY